MAKRKKRFRRKKDPLDYIALPSLPKLDLDPDTKRGIFIVLILAIGAISFLSLFDLAGGMGVYIEKGIKLAEGSKDELLKTCAEFKYMWEHYHRSENLKKLSV